MQYYFYVTCITSRYTYALTIMILKVEKRFGVLYLFLKLTTTCGSTYNVKIVIHMLLKSIYNILKYLRLN